MLTIGITGPTGSGKTTALEALRELGAEVIDCDALYHQLIRGCAPMLDEIRRRFGDGVFDRGVLDRKALGRVVFGDGRALDDLNGITHRYIAAAVDRRLKRARDAGRDAAAVDAVALLESGLKDKCDCTVAVTAPEGLRLGWIMARDGIGEEYARARMAAQKTADWFEARCDYVLRNPGEGREEFFQTAKTFFQNIFDTKDLR